MDAPRSHSHKMHFCIPLHFFSIVFYIKMHQIMFLTMFLTIVLTEHIFAYHCTKTDVFDCYTCIFCSISIMTQNSELCIF